MIACRAAGLSGLVVAFGLERFRHWFDFLVRLLKDTSRVNQLRFSCFYSVTSGYVERHRMRYGYHSHARVYNYVTYEAYRLSIMNADILLYHG
jgi:hypothetical protein